jgi:hypothetical protein
MKVRLTVKHYPQDAPGSWGDSKLNLNIVADREVVLHVERAIQEALGSADTNLSFPTGFGGVKKKPIEPQAA